ncbi:hypothetical protein CHS0354_007804 [Potamilus streckersoni]|uniref:ZP domain-containing protein n=1 Tax=Potamilus streckersoni TaxID=2493646 RepID=A0AAE0VSD1_9BIVA|nr:hypothetical protein CHS0354_007804 [Potamilus streckersoni]
MMKLLLPLLLIGVSSGSPPEQIQYACTDNGEIQVMSDGITQYKSLYATENDKQCTVNRTTSAGGSVKFIIYGCNVVMPVKATLMEEEQDTIGTNVIFGGKDVAGYELQCGGVPIGGSITVLQAKLQVGNTGFEFHQEHQVSLDLKMEIREHGLVRTSSNPVKVGTPLNLTISGSDHFRFYARSCLVEGLKGQVKNLITEGKTLDPSIITSFSDLAPGDQGRMETWATLYAFHFVDSEEITVNCTVFACRLDDVHCQTSIPHPHDSRKKRDVNEGNGSRMNYVEVRIRVIDEYYYHISSGRALNFFPGLFVFAALMYFLLG